MDVKDLAWNETMTNRYNNPLFPRSIRGLIVGKSGCGKTLLLNFLLRPGWLDYNNLNVFGKSLFQPVQDPEKSIRGKTTETSDSKAI